LVVLWNDLVRQSRQLEVNSLGNWNDFSIEAQRDTTSAAAVQHVRDKQCLLSSAYHTGPSCNSLTRVVTQTKLGGLTISSGCKFPKVYMCQKLCKLAGSRQSYCKNKQAYFFWPTLMSTNLAKFFQPHGCHPQPDDEFVHCWPTGTQVNHRKVAVDAQQ